MIFLVTEYCPYNLETYVTSGQLAHTADYYRLAIQVS